VISALGAKGKYAMNKLIIELQGVLSPGMILPKEILSLYDWVYGNEHVVENSHRTFGHLGSDGVTSVKFIAEGNKNLHYWFGHHRHEILDRLCVFCKTGGDGSMGAFWLAPDGTQKIVHLGSGSGSGSTMVCVLADNFLDFMRLLAIGYDEIAWDHELSDVSASPLGEDGIKYRNWLKKSFGVIIPTRGSEIVKNISLMNDLNSVDVFNNWVSCS